MDAPSDWPCVSVLIATRDRPHDLQRCVASVLACDYPHFDVVIVDQGKTAAPLPADPRLRVVRSETVGKTRGLNHAMALATGAILAFTDDDCTVSAGWLKSGASMLNSEPNTGLVFGALLAIPHDPAEVFVPTFLPGERRVITGAGSAHVRGGAGANMFARREVMATLGGFDQLLGPGTLFKSCEEFDVYYRALRAGYSVVRDPETVVVHWGARSLADGSGQRLLLDYYFGEGVVFGKHCGAGDWQAGRLALRIWTQEVNWALRGALRGRLTGVRRTASWSRGFVKGFRRAADATTRLFRERGRPGSSGTTYAGRDRRRTAPAAGRS